MVAEITGFVTRAQAGLRPPKSVTRNITPSRGGAAVHYGGPASRIRSHADCVRIWRGWQTFHMNSRGWADIAYTGGFCDHGYAFAGRGHGVRTAAQGTNDGNQRFHAYVWLGGEGETPTQLALKALDWWIAEGRRVGGNGMEVVEHKRFHQTACPGPKLTQQAQSRNRKHVPYAHEVKPTPPPGPAPAPKPSGYRYPLPAGRPVFSQGARGDKVKAVQERLHIKADGSWGPGTQHAFLAFQRGAKIRADGVYGNDSRAAFIRLGRG